MTNFTSAPSSTTVSVAEESMQSEFQIRLETAKRTAGIAPQTTE